MSYNNVNSTTMSATNKSDDAASTATNKSDDAPSTDNKSDLLKQKLKYDWYQTETHVTVNVLIKHLDRGQVKISFEEKSFTINFCLDDSFNLNLLKPIIPEKSTYRLTPTKIELKLKKLNEDLWANLEPIHGVEQKEVAQANRKWDKLVETELKDDPAQGEAALNELFQKIYSEGSDEVKKAMNKSFLESGGTVLSTNWNEVGEKKVDIKPPDGMEWKKWDEP